LNVSEINQRWSLPENIDSWSQMVIKHTDDNLTPSGKACLRPVGRFIAPGFCRKV
jgi:hypothetical protein